MYSVEFHPDRGDVISDTFAGSNTVAASMVSGEEAETSPAGRGGANSNLELLADPKNHQLEEDVSSYSLGLDPAFYEAQIERERVEASDNSCPFPPGFGPCSDQNHVHRTLARAQNLSFVDAVRGTNEGVCGSECLSESVPLTEKGSSAIDGEETASDETRYKINEQAFKSAREGRGFTDSIDAEFSSALKGGSKPLGEELQERPDESDAGVAIPDSVDTCVNFHDVGHGDPDLTRPVVDESRAIDDNEHSGQTDSLCDEISDEDDSEEVEVTREIWSSGGVSFVSSDEEELVDRLTNRRKGGRNRSKKQRQYWKPNCIKGRTLATRTLKSCSRLWL
ncbi:hypothetical protein PIB30_053663 [Stylosanthes scabra]|uniref:Uncharacterized protein n=1 Tax=Stylosanthes scabra TaxID=79078 RepID=A0ABU6QI96_9FABA|nr:hypothetical protein [Stylosanthes scabra]